MATGLSAGDHKLCFFLKFANFRLIFVEIAQIFVVSILFKITNFPLPKCDNFASTSILYKRRYLTSNAVYEGIPAFKIALNFPEAFYKLSITNLKSWNPRTGKNAGLQARG
jgi:hypothetical protein